MSDKSASISKLLALLKENQEPPLRGSKDEKEDESEILQRILAKKLASSKNITKEEKRELLDRRFAIFQECHDFQKGQFVCWKPGLRNKGTVDYDTPAIVIEKLDKPVLDHENDSGSPYFREPLDLVLAFLDEDNDFMMFYADSRRFMPFLS